jgi:Domain of unknown function (DUF1839)
MLSLFGLDPASYATSPLHSPERTFRETNCYTDVWIELLHAAGCDAAPSLSFALTVNFEGDQWTFFKPPPEDLETLYGIDVHEMQLYRPLVDHICEQLQTGRTIAFEADSFYLPDTAATAYQQAHVKSTIIVEAIDPATERLRYFHNAGYFELAGADYRGVFRLGREFSADVLPPYAELVRFDARPKLSGDALAQASRNVLAKHLTRLPKRNPWLAFGERLTADFPALLAGTEANYHAYAFATVRQCGAAFELAASCAASIGAPSEAVQALARQTAGAKTLLLKLARRKPFDSAPILNNLAADWDLATAQLKAWAPQAETERLALR